MSSALGARRFLLAALAVAGLGPVRAKADEVNLPEGVRQVTSVEGVTEYVLENGLRVLLIPDDSQPTVTVNMTILVGSRHEGYGEAGMAHLLEHLLFKGCPKFPDVPKALRDHGASAFNGTTWTDRTNYYETMPASDENLEFGLELEADRLVNSFVRMEDLLSEFTVVRNEFEMGENDPFRVLFQRMLATAYEWHNYGKSTIGNRSDIERVPIGNLQEFYRKYYRIDNAMLVVGGRFNQQQALDLIAKHFASLKPPAEKLPVAYTEEPAQDGDRLVTLRRVGAVGMAGAVYHVPAASHPDYAACETLQQVLASEPDGRLYKALVETKRASSVGGMAFAWHDPTILACFAQTDPDKVEEARTILIETLENLAEDPVTEEEVERVKARFKSNREQLFASSQGLAVQLSEWAGAGDWRLFFLHRDRMETVTADDVNRVAKQYLVSSNRTAGVFVPTKTPERATLPAAPSIAELVGDYRGRDKIVAGEAFDPTPDNVEARVVRGAIGGVKTALLAKETRGETVNLVLNLRYGNAEALHGKTKAKAADFLGQMLMRGTKSRTRQQIKDELEKLGAQMSVMGGVPGLLTVRIQAKRDALPAVLDVAGDILRNPTFPETEFEILKREVLDQFREAKTDPHALANTAFRRKLATYAEDDPRYVPTLDESIARTEAATIAEVRELYEALLSAQAGELAIVGDFDPDAAVKKVESLLADWTTDVAYQRINTVAQSTAGATERILTPDKENAVYVAGLTMRIKDSNPDFAALDLGNFVLGRAPLASRLSKRVRQQEGLSYGVASMVNAHPIDELGTFMAFAITNPQNIAKVNKAIAEEITKFLADGLSDEELADAKQAFLQARQLSRSDDGALAGQLANGLFVGRTMAFEKEYEQRIAAEEPATIKAVFGKYLDLKNLAIINAGDFEKAEKTAAEEGKAAAADGA